MERLEILAAIDLIISRLQQTRSLPTAKAESSAKTPLGDRQVSIQLELTAKRKKELNLSPKGRKGVAEAVHST
jgi:hypothetical protein